MASVSENTEGISIARGAIRRPVAVWLGIIFCLIGGLWGLSNVGRLEDPSFTLKTALVFVPYPGATAEEVEEEVADVIETALQQMRQLDRVESKSMPGMAQVTVEIVDSYGPDEIPQVWDEMRRRIGDVRGELPAGARDPIVNDDFGDVFGLFYAVTTQGLTPTEERDLARMLRQHADYVAALKETGAEVIELDPLEDFPDALFVEDTALCLPEGAILMRPGAPSRMGEVARIAPVIRGLFDRVAEIGGPGTIEGGDILTTPREVLVGQSARTDAAGIAELRDILDGWGRPLREIAVPEGVLHFKTDCSLLDGGTILATERLAASGCFDGYRVILTAPGEEAAANAIRFNSVVLMPAGFPATAERLRAEGYDLREIGNSECAKLDGGMSCLSLRFQGGPA